MTTFQPLTRRTFLAATLAAAASTATACSFNDDSDSDNSRRILRQQMIPVTNLDPAIGGGGSAAGNILQAGLMEGLVVYDAANGHDVLPGAAKEWTVSDDGLVYTFVIRTEAKWSNGDAVTAQDFEWNWRRLLSPATAGDGVTSYNVNVGVAGAAAFLNGETDDFEDVGVAALDDATLEITLEAPNSDLLFLVAGVFGLPVHPGTVEEHPADWSEASNWVGNGAYVLESWRANTSAVLVPNDQYWDHDNYHIDRWEVRFNDGGDSAGMLSYQSDEIDIFRIEGDLAAVTADPELDAELLTSPSGQFRCLLMMSSHHPALHDIRVRRALSLAIDREQIAAVTRPDVPGYTLIPDGVPGYDEIPAITYDVEQARELLAAAGYAEGKGMPTLEFLLPFAAPWVEAVGEMWRTGLGVESTVDLVEVGVYGTKRLEVHPESYTGFSYGNFGVIPTTLFAATTMSLAQKWEALMMPAVATAEYRQLDANETISPDNKAAEIAALVEANLYPEFARYKSLIIEAKAELDPNRQHDLLVQAAIAREESYVAIPVLWGGYSLLVKPHVRNLRPWSFPTVFTTEGVTVRD